MTATAPTILAEAIVRVPTTLLVPYGSNARSHSADQIAAIARSIAEFGFNNPILVAADNTVIAGHARLEAARLLDLDSVPVVYLPHLTDAQRRAYILADNQLALNAGWDMAMLASECEALAHEGIDLALLGFNDADLRRIERIGAEGDAPPNPGAPRFQLIVEFDTDEQLAHELDALQARGFRCKRLE